MLWQSHRKSVILQSFYIVSSVYMRNFSLLVIFVLINIICSASNRATADWEHYWIKSTNTDSSSQIWFRRSYLIPKRIRHATAEMVSNGRFELFVNGRNVSNEIFTPSTNCGPDTVMQIRYDIGRFFQNGNDTATIAVWYAPTFPIHNDKQLSLQIFGTTQDNEEFQWHTDSTWMFHASNASTDSAGNEHIDGNRYIPEWKSNDCDMTGWQYANKASEESTTPVILPRTWRYQPLFITKIHRPISVDINKDTVVYDFGESINGSIRLTLRGMGRNDIIHADGLEYISQGIDDEQAFRRFTYTNTRYVSVDGTGKFSPDKIVKVEFLEIGTRYRR
jgi:hypothetical protein